MGVSKALAQAELILDEKTIWCAPLYSVVAVTEGTETATKNKPTSNFMVSPVFFDFVERVKWTKW